MPNLKVLVAEDNPMHANKIEMLLDEMGYDLLGPFANSEEVLRNFQAVKPDIVLLDIELAGNLNGIEIAQKIKDSTPTPIIFTTALEDVETMKKASGTDPYAYLVKPIERSSLQAAMELAVHRFAKDQEKITALEPFSGWTEDILVKDSFFIKSGSKLEKVHNDDILWVELAEERYCDIITSGRNYHLRTSMASLSNKLDPSKFVRTHRKYIVNANKVKSIDESDLTIEIGEDSLPLGSTYKSQLLKRLNML